MKNLKYFIPAGIILGVLAIAFTAHANPLRFPPGVFASSATTSPIFLTVGATSTLATYDTYSNNGVSGGGSTQAMDKATVLIQFAASSTSSILLAGIEYSQDGIDWYQDDTVTPATVSTLNITQPILYSWAAFTTATSSRALIISTPLRFVRVRLQTVGAAGAVWGGIQPQKQSN